MAAFPVLSPFATQVKLGSPYSTGTSLRYTYGSPSAAVATPVQRLEVTATQKLMGKVVTDTNDKSVTVEVSRIAVYPKYKKRIKTTKNYIVHDPDNSAKKGDFVRLAKCAPVSKRKQFVVVEIRKDRQERNSASPDFITEPALPPFESVASA